MAGPLTGVKVVELAGIGPGPFTAMLLSDLGAEVIRVDRAQAVMPIDPDRPNAETMNRGRRSVGVDLKSPAGRETVLRLIDRADAVIEGFRPGVTERLGVGPDVCLERNPRLVYGRMTGWGQDGPYASAAGHDINYIALAGSLAHIGRVGEKPTPPMNLVGDFGGGGMLLAFGIACGIIEARTSGRGQVIDAAMVDGAATLMSMIWSFRTMFGWGPRGTNMLDTGAPYYDTYETADGEYISIGAIEPQFFAELLRRLDIDPASMPAQMDQAGHPQWRARFTELFRTRTRAEWNGILEYSDACYAPVLTMDEAMEHPHVRARGTIIEVEGIAQPAPSPRFSRTPGAVSRPAAWPGQHTDEVLTDWGFTAAEVAELRSSGAVA